MTEEEVSRPSSTCVEGGVRTEACSLEEARFNSDTPSHSAVWGQHLAVRRAVVLASLPVALCRRPGLNPRGRWGPPSVYCWRIMCSHNLWL